MSLTPANKIKVQLIDYLLCKFSAESVLVGCEVPYMGGKRWADIVLLQTNKLIAYEIKSEADTLRRFKNQYRDYMATFDKTYLVVPDGPLLAQVLDKYTNRLGIISFSSNDSTFKVIRLSKPSTRPRKLNLSSFIWKDQLQKNLRDYSISATKLRNNYASKTSWDNIHKDALEAIKSRYTLRYKRFLKERGDVTTAEDLALLTDSKFEIENFVIRKSSLYRSRLN